MATGNLHAIETTVVRDRYGSLASKVHVCPSLGSVVVERYLDDHGAVCEVYRHWERTVPVEDAWSTAEGCVRTELEWAGRF
jgi:hypothetical protein